MPQSRRYARRSRVSGGLSLAALALAAGAWLAGAGLPVRAQTRPRAPVFGAGVEVIRLNVSVTDGKSRYVTGLSANDFDIFEDGVKQPLTFFTRDPLPLSVSLLIDCSSSMESKLPVAQAAGARFLETLRVEDRAQIVQFSDRPAVLQDFTSDRQALTNALRSTRASGATVLYNALYVVMKQLGQQGTAASPRRRAIVLLSDGEDTASVVSDEQVLDLARQEDVAVYPIALRSERPSDRAGIASGQATHFLTALARDTGGMVCFPKSLSELDGIYDKIAEELRTQYTLGYVSANGLRDGKWRRIVIRMQRDDVQVRHKIGYYAPRG
jgi:Ca-activated chloride channel homolog